MKYRNIAYDYFTIILERIQYSIYMGVIDIPQQFHGDNVTIDTREGVCVEYLPVTKKKADPQVC